jgi:hypothetical protein
VDCDWKLNTDQEGTTGTAHFTSPAQSMDDAIRAAGQEKATEVEALTRAHITGDHPNIVTDLMRTISTLNARLAVHDPATGVSIRLDAEQGNKLYRWLEDTDLIDTKTDKPSHYWETPLAPVQQQLSAWLRTGGGEDWSGLQEPLPAPDHHLPGQFSGRFRSPKNGGQRPGNVDPSRARPESHDNAGGPGALPTVSADRPVTDQPTGCGHHTGYHLPGGCTRSGCRCGISVFDIGEYCDPGPLNTSLKPPITVPTPNHPVNPFRAAFAELGHRMDRLRERGY